MKLGTVDCIWEPTAHNNFGGDSATWVVWAHTRLVTSRSFSSSSSSSLPVVLEWVRDGFFRSPAM